MVERHRLLGAERGDDGGHEALGKGDQFRPGAGRGDPAARDDHGPLGRHQRTKRFLDAAALGFGPKGRHAGEGLLDHDVQVRLAERHVIAPNTPKVEMDRPRHARGGRAKGMAKCERQFAHVGHLGAELGDHAERRQMLHFLVGVAVLLAVDDPPGERKHRRAGQIGILQPGSEIERTDRLRAANPDAPRDAGIAVRHVGGCLLAMGHDGRDAEALHIRQRLGDADGHEEKMRDAIGVQCLGNKAPAAHLRQ